MKQESNTSRKSSNPHKFDNYHSTPYHKFMEPKVKKQHPLTALAFLEVGIFEIGLVAIVLILLFSALNYFNILPVSDVLPQYFGWLPKKHTQTKLTSPNQILQTPKTITIIPTITVSPETSAKEILLNFLPEIFNSSFLPPASGFTFKQSNEQNFIFSWNAKQVTIGGAIEISVQSSHASTFSLGLTQTSNTPPSPTLALTVISPIFSIQPKGIWGCKPLRGITYCENFWEEQSGEKRGLSVLGLLELREGGLGLLISFCQHNKNSDLYSWKSCTVEFKNTGVL